MNIKKLSLVLLLTSSLFTPMAYAMETDDKDFQGAPTLVVCLSQKNLLEETKNKFEINKDNIKSITFKDIEYSLEKSATKEVFNLLPTFSSLETLDIGDEELPIEIINKIPSLKTIKCSITYGDDLKKFTKLNSSVEKIMFFSKRKEFEFYVSELPDCFKDKFSLKTFRNQIKSGYYPASETYDGFPELGECSHFVGNDETIEFNSNPENERILFPSIGFISQEYPLIRILPIRTLSQLTNELIIHYFPEDQKNVYWSDLFFQAIGYQGIQMWDKTITITRQSKKN